MTPERRSEESPRRDRLTAARFDDWAFWLSAGVLLWICAFLVYYLFSGSWAGPPGLEAWLRWIVGVAIFYRGCLYAIDMVRGRGPVLTRHPATAFPDMLALGLLVGASVDARLGTSPLEPLFLIFLAVVPILYRNIESRRGYVLTTVLLVLEAILVFVVPAHMHHREVYQRDRVQLVTVREELRMMAVAPEVVGIETDLREVMGQVPQEVAELPTVVRFVEDVEDLLRDLLEEWSPSRRSLSEVELRWQQLREGEVQQFHSEFERYEHLLAPVGEMTRGLRERLQMQQIGGFVPGLDETVLEGRIGYIETMATRISWELKRAQALAQRRDLELRTASMRVLVQHAFTVMILALGFMVQFLIRRFVSRRIETERSRTFSEMLSERHRMDAQNWINLTAGLTHSIGNEVRGYDVFLEEIIEWLEETHPDAPSSVREKLQFIYRTNQARLGFVQFLREFSILKRVHDDQRPVPSGLRRIDLERTLRQAHARVQAIETCYNPPESEDPGDVRKRRKFFGTSLEIRHVSPDNQPIVLQRGREAVLDFFFYELLKNALRNCSGTRPLVTLLQREPGERHVTVRIINDLAVDALPPGRCTRCSVETGSEPLLAAAMKGREVLCQACLREQVQEDLEGCFYPGRGSGTGLGLFVIKHFLEEYYHGIISCGVERWCPEEHRFMVYFMVVIPDDLSRVIEEKNAEWGDVEVSET